MKNFTKIFTAILVTFAAYSCVADATNDLGVQTGSGEGQSTITLSFGELKELTKVQLGEETNNVYPLYWSDGDQIAVNGQPSLALKGVGKNATEAVFSVSSVQYPLSIVFPAPTDNPDSGIEEESNGATLYPVKFPATQSYVAGNVDPEAIVLYGYAGVNDAGIVKLNHLTGVLQINVKGTATLKSLTIEAVNGIAGTYSINCATGKLSEVEVSDTITMSFGSGLTLNANTATPIYVTVPAGNHGIIRVTLHTATDKMTATFDSIYTAVNAGCVYEFDELTYVADAADNIFEINSVSTLRSFASKAASLYPFTKAVVTKDINMSGTSWTPIEGFGAFEFDGNGKTITGLSAPLFGVTGAYIHDLTLANVNFNIIDAPRSGAFAQSIQGGALINCHATGTSTINCANYYYDGYRNGYYSYAHGGLVGFIDNTAIDNCTSDVDINILANYNAPLVTTEDGEVKKSYKTAVGGIVGCYATNTILTNLVNKGNITYNSTTQTGTLYMGGITGRDTEHDCETAHIIAMSNCTNEGNITTAKGSASTGAINIAGIAGYVNLYESKITATNLVNTGNIQHNGSAAYVMVGGIVANTCEANLTDCSNGGAIGIGAGADAKYAYVGGILARGVSSGTTILDNCNNNGDITISPNLTISGDDNGLYVLAAGIVASSYSSCVIQNCNNTKPVKLEGIISGTNNTYGAMLGGICAYASNSLRISNCTNSGAIQYANNTQDTNKNVSFIRMGGIVGMNRDGYSCTISKCTNDGDASYNGYKLSKIEVGVGGILGYATNKATVSECTNNATIGGAGKCGKYMGFGGIVGMTYRGKINIKECINNGDIAQSTNTLKKGEVDTRISSGNGFGGVVGILTNTTEISGCENWGKISITNTNGVNLYAGGVIGWAFMRDESDTSGAAKSIKNCANYADLTFTGTAQTYAAGGVIGCITTFENTSHYWQEISGLKSVANLTFNVTITSGCQYNLGGIVGLTEVYNNTFQNKTYVALNNCTFYGDLVTKSSDILSNFGIITGCPRALHIAKDSQVGGKINNSNLHDNNNWLTYLYKGGVSESTANNDGCSCITAKPAN